MCIRDRCKTGPSGVTKPAACTLHGILKFDCLESPHLVYNEFVALRLAQALRIPVADGVLTTVGDGYAYASLEVALPGLDLPDMRKSDYLKVANRYPDQAAAILAFDYWIGNRDRGGNVKAAMLSQHLPLFRAFDHQFALLDAEQGHQTVSYTHLLRSTRLSRRERVRQSFATHD